MNCLMKNISVSKQYSYESSIQATHTIPRNSCIYVYIAETFTNLQLMNHWPKNVLIVALELQAVNCRNPYYQKRCCIHYDGM